MMVVGEITDPVEILIMTGEREAEVVVMDSLNGETDPGICSHLLSEFPDLLILALSPGLEQAIIYRQSISKELLLNLSEKEILSAIRQARPDNKN
jgi:hypothetical protein